MNKAGLVHKNSPSEVVGIVVVVIVGIAMAWLSWLKWCDPIIDFGRELYIPWALCQGKILYKDINMFFYGPLSYHVNASLFKIFGVHINTIVGFNLLLILVAAFLIHKIMKTISNASCAFFSVLAFIILFAFPRYFPILNDNFVTPYSHAATHGTVLSFLALYLVSQYLNTRRLAYASFCWFVIGLVLLTKVELFLGLFLSMLLTWTLILRSEHPTAKIILKRLTVWTSSMMLPLLFCAAFLARVSTFSGAIRQILNPYFLIFHRGHSFSNLLTNMMGMNEPIANVSSMLYWLVVYLLVVLAVVALNHFLNVLGRKSGSHILPAAIATLISAPFVIATMRGNLPYLDYFLPLPLIVAAHAMYSLFKLYGTQRYTLGWNQHLVSLSFSVFALILLFRLFFNTRIVHYGFFLALPGFLVLLNLFLFRLPVLMKRISGNATIGMVPIFILFLCVLWPYFDRSFGMYQLVNYPIRSNHEVIMSFDLKYADTGEIIQQTVDEIQTVVGQNETLTAFPEGLMFNYLARRQSASPYTAFLPTFFSVFGNTIIESLQKRPPDFVLLVERSTIEYGYPYFGADYATEALDWIRDNYVEISQIGKKPFSGEGFGVVIMKRM